MQSIQKNVDDILQKLTAEGADFEMVDVEINGQTLPVYKSAPPSLREIYELCLLHGDKPFLVYLEARLTFRETYQGAACLSAALRKDFNIQKGDRVAIAMRNNPEWVIAFMAVTALGAVAVPMNAWWTTQELEYGLVDCGAKLLVADNQRLQRVKPLLPKLAIPVICVEPKEVAEWVVAFDQVLHRYAEEALPASEIHPDDDVTILYTSGSTGLPKGVVGTHRGIISAMYSWVLLAFASQEAGAAPVMGPNGASALLTVPLFHVTGCHSLFLLSVLIGRKLVMMYKWDPEQAVKLIEEEQITYFNGVPTMSQELLDVAEKSDRDLSSLVDLYSAGAARPPEHVRRINQDFKLNPGSGYGLTETNAMGAVITGLTYLHNPASVGIPSPSVTQIQIVDEQGTALAAGERGEICIKSPANARCYWNKPEATAEAFKNGWFHTGDVGYLDKDNMLFIVDRIKDIIIRGGENISCIEVESAIYTHKEVAEVAVFGLPDDRLGEIVAARIFLKPHSNLTESTLLDFLSEHLAAFKIPAQIEFSAEPLPRTATDKILKRQIKEEALAAMHK